MKYLIIPIILLTSACTTTQLVPEMKKLEVPEQLMQPMPENLNTVEVPNAS